MTADALDRIGDRITPAATRIGQQTAVEQARAVAQVAAQIQVAQAFPRDLTRIRQQVAEACSHYELARTAFYAVENRGQGLSVHLARELAVIWGNLEYGVHELRRDDAAGESEVQAFAWDCERNSRATRTFVNPHARMKKVSGKQTRIPLIDLQDIYLSNQNVGARAMRETIFAVLPRWLIDDAERRCRDTLGRGPGKPFDERRRDAVAWFDRQRVTLRQLEQRVGRSLEEWTPEDLATLEVIATSIGRGETTAAEQFDPAEQRVSVDELGAPAPDDSPAAPAEPAEPSHPTDPVGDQRPATQRSIGALIGKLRDLGVETDEDQRAWLTTELRRPVTTRTDLNRGEVSSCIQVVETLIEARDLEAADRAAHDDNTDPQ
jgi:hypothetical protein